MTGHCFFVSRIEKGGEIFIEKETFPQLSRDWEPSEVLFCVIGK